MRVDDFSRARQPHPVNQTGVIQHIGIDDVILADKRCQEAHVRGVTAAEEQRFLGAGKPGKLLFQSSPLLGLTGEQARAGAADLAGVCHRVDGSFVKLGVFRESQIIVGAKIHAVDFGQTAAQAACFKGAQPLLQFLFPGR